MGYIYPSFLPLVIGGLIILLGMVGAIRSGLGVFFGSLLLGGVLIYPGTVMIIDIRQQIKRLEENDQLNDVVQEFSSSISVLNDSLRIGPRLLFGKRNGPIVGVDEIRQIYQSVHKTNFVEDRRTLNIQNNQGDNRILCKLPLKGRANYELEGIIKLIVEKNPSVQVGLKR